MKIKYLRSKQASKLIQKLTKNHQSNQLGHMRSDYLVFERRIEKSDKRNLKEKKEKKA